MTPEFAIIGHPNEGKSSVLSTLAEDDSVIVSATSGETVECRTFPVLIDGTEVLRFTDTPGFQNPARVLSMLEKLEETSGDQLLKDFLVSAANIPSLHHDRELLKPIEHGAGIIYVVDGSRRIKNFDRAEMAILRLTGKPKMAIINCKDDNNSLLDEWKREFSKNFNAYQTFNAHRATYAERIRLLEALRAIDQDWYGPLSVVIAAFQSDWSARNDQTADIIVEQITECLTLQLPRDIRLETTEESTREILFQKYKEKIYKKEKSSQNRIRALYKHNIFNYQLPTHSLIYEDLFAEKTWQLFGLTRKQTIIAGGAGGAAIGAGLDLATLGHSLGLFMAIGGVAGSLGAIFRGKREQIDPGKAITLLFILLNRVFHYYRHTINWAHGRREYQQDDKALACIEKTDLSFTSRWSADEIKICHSFYKKIKKSRTSDSRDREAFKTLIRTTLQKISESD